MEFPSPMGVPGRPGWLGEAGGAGEEGGGGAASQSLMKDQMMPWGDVCYIYYGFSGSCLVLRNVLPDRSAWHTGHRLGATEWHSWDDITSDGTDLFETIPGKLMTLYWLLMANSRHVLPLTSGIRRGTQGSTCDQLTIFDWCLTLKLQFSGNHF